MTDTEMPRSLRHDICVQQVGSETLVYHKLRHQAFCLNRTSSTIWRLCDGAHTIEQLASAATLGLNALVDKDLVLFALQELRRDGLLQSSVPTMALPVVSRRKLVLKMGASAAMLLPVVAAILAPRAAQAYNGGVGS